MREIRQHGSAGGGPEPNRASLPRFVGLHSLVPGGFVGPPSLAPGGFVGSHSLVPSPVRLGPPFITVAQAVPVS